MKLKSFISALILSWSSLSGSAWAEDVGLRYINANGVIKCGTNLFAHSYAYKDEDGDWRGIDAEMCKVFSTAIFGSDKFFEMVNVNPLEVTSALNSNKIDVMLGSTPYSASTEMKNKIVPTNILYFDKQVFLAKNPNEAESMLDFKNNTICTIIDSEDLYNLDTYNRRYALRLKIIKFVDLQKAKEAFMLNRCNLITGNETYLKSIVKDLKKAHVEILPEVLATRPIYAYVERDNTQLQSIIKWIINGLYLAESKKINSENISTIGGASDISVRNLLGFDEKLWKKFGLKPEWMRLVIENHGNYAEIYERNMGIGSELEIKRKEGKLIENKGFVIPQPFL